MHMKYTLLSNYRLAKWHYKVHYSSTNLDNFSHQNHQNHQGNRFFHYIYFELECTLFVMFGTWNYPWRHNLQSKKINKCRLYLCRLYFIKPRSLIQNSCATKGQLNSEWLFDILNFLKKQLRKLMNFCPKIKKLFKLVK